VGPELGEVARGRAAQATRTACPATTR
jgi:hypothetical protein